MEDKKKMIMQERIDRVKIWKEKNGEWKKGDIVNKWKERRKRKKRERKNGEREENNRVNG